MTPQMAVEVVSAHREWRGRVGADGPDVGWLAGEGWTALTGLAQTLEELPYLPAEIAREQLRRWGALFADYRREALVGGALDLADAFDALGEAAERAAERAGRGAGDAFRAFWGIEPTTAFVIAGGLAVAILAAGGFALATPAARAAVVGAGGAAVSGARLAWRVAW